MKIYVSDDSLSTALNPIGWDEEKDMQLYIQKNPDCICNEISYNNKKAVLIAREFQSDAGEIDFLIIDEDGKLYIVESKLSKNPTKLHVHSQLYDYARALWHRYRHYEDFDQFIQECDSSLRKYISIGFEEHLKNEFKLDDEQLEELEEKLKKNISKNSFIYLILAMDKIDSDAIKDQIIYHNNIGNGKVKMFGVELSRYSSSDKKQIIVPKFYGIESIESSIESAESGSKWSEEEFYEFIDSNKNLDERERGSVHKLIETCKGLGAEMYGSKGDNPDAHIKFNTINKTRSVFKVRGRDAYIRIFFEAFDNHSDLRNQFIKLCSEIGIEEVKSGFDNGKKWPLISKERWMSRIDDFITVLKKTCT